MTIRVSSYEIDFQTRTDVVIEAEESTTELCRDFRLFGPKKRVRIHTFVAFHDNPDLGAHAFINQLCSGSDGQLNRVIGQANRAEEVATPF